MGRLLVTGGAGYIGAHVARAARAAGHEVIVVDDLSEGHAAAVEGRLVVADLRDRAAMSSLLATGFDAVLHLAARTSIGASMRDPLAYWDTNVVGTLSLLEAMHEAGCARIVFSSACSVYGAPDAGPLPEQLPFAPISVYGDTKVAVEHILGAAERAGRLRAACLRFFNAAGASADAHLGEVHHPETHLIPLALQAITGGPPLVIHGAAHPTPDGTCIRDYVHVEDLAAAHLAALDRLLSGQPGGAWNLGSGRGASVREVLASIERVTQRRVPHVEGPMRPGDPPALVADTGRAARELGWRAVRDLDTMVTDAWRWHLAPRYGSSVDRERAAS